MFPLFAISLMGRMMVFARGRMRRVMRWVEIKIWEMLDFERSENMDRVWNLVWGCAVVVVLVTLLVSVIVDALSSWASNLHFPAICTLP